MTSTNYKVVGYAKKSRFGSYLIITVGDRIYSIYFKDIENFSQGRRVPVYERKIGEGFLNG